MMTAKMMETLKNAGIAKEWHMGDMHRLYIDLAKADKLYIEHNDNLKNGRLNLNARERRNGKLWVDLETGEIGTKDLSPEEIIVSQIMELVAFLTPAETAETATEETATEETATEETTTEETTEIIYTDTTSRGDKIPQKGKYMDNMLFYVQNLNKSEESITLLYNAAALNFAFSGEQRAIWEGIKSQEEAVTAYCKRERERLADIIRQEGKVLKNMSFPSSPFTGIIYDYNGEKYKIETEFGETTSIEPVEM